MTSTESRNVLNITPPNLDHEDITDEDIREAERVIRAYRWYRRFRQAASAYRASGNIQDALRWEDKAESTYRQLPEWARW